MRHVAEATRQEMALRRRAHIHGGGTVGERIADQAAATIGSWRFIIIQTVLVAVWVAGNVYEALHFDPFPFVLLNLMFSVQAAYTGPILLLAGNRQAQKDRQRDDRDDAEIGEILEIQREQREHDRWTRSELEGQAKDLVAIARALKAERGRA